jgi:hypothetical protein
MTDLRQLATQLALDPTVPPKVRCKALDVLYALGSESPSIPDGDPKPTPLPLLRKLDPHNPAFGVNLNLPPEMPPEMMSEFEPGLLGGPPGVWVDAVTPPEVK